MKFSDFEKSMQDALREVHSSSAGDAFRTAVRKVCGLSQEANLRIAATFAPDCDEIAQVINVLSKASEQISVHKIRLQLPEDVEKEIDIMGQNIDSRILDLEETRQQARELSSLGNW